MFHHHAHHVLSTFWLLAVVIRHPLVAMIAGAGALVVGVVFGRGRR